jgi:C_GCAxxG_C_C family probable redox protein
MKKVEKANVCFSQGFNCAQAVLSAFSPEMGVNRKTALRIGGAFGAGVGRMGDVCGAVNGAYMVIGLAHAKTTKDGNKEKKKAYELAREFTKKFKACHGSIHCRTLLGCDLSTPEGLERATKKDLFKKRCPLFVNDAAEIVGELLRK